jgi:hypothetical protein
MINKEIIYRNGGIERDFENKNIPQYSHMQVSVNCLIPAALLQGLDNYAVLLAAEFKADDTEEYEQRPSLVMFTGKALVIEGIDYIKFMALLPIAYTNEIGRLKLTPYVQTTAEFTESVEDPETHEVTEVTRVATAIQQTFTEAYLIVVKASKDTNDLSLEEPEVVTELLALINSKRIFYERNYREASYGELLWHIWNDYNPALTIYKGAIIMAKYNKFKASDDTYTKKKTNIYFNCHVEEGGAAEEYILMLDVETREMTKYYNITRTGTEGAYNYSYQEVQTTYNKEAIDALIQDLWDAKVDRTQKVNGHALVGDIEIQKGDPGIDLGNVQNYGVVDTPSAAAEHFYITAKGVYDYLTGNYGTPEQFAENINHLNQLWLLLQDDNNDVVDTIHDLLQIFQDYPEAQGMVAVIEDLQERVEALEHATRNGFIVIDRANNTDLLTLTPDDFNEQDNPTYEDYPYTAEIEDERFIGAIKVSVIYDVPNANSDNLSSGVELNNTTGKITIYAMERPSENVIIEEIDIINSVAVYQLYSNNVVAKVNQNAAKIQVLEGAVADINNTLIPALQNGKLDKETTISTGVKRKFQITNSGYAVESVTDEATGELAQIAMKQNIISVQVDDGDGGLATIELYKNGSNKHVIEETAEVIRHEATTTYAIQVGQHIYTFSTDGKINIDGKEIKRSNGVYWTTTPPTESGGYAYMDPSDVYGYEDDLSPDEVNDDGYMLNNGDLIIETAEYNSTKRAAKNLYVVLDRESIPDPAPEGKIKTMKLGAFTPIVTTLTGNGSNDAAVPSVKLLKDQLDLKISTSEKATTWVNTTLDDGYVPSAKLVKTSLDGKMANAIKVDNPSENSNFTITNPTLVTGKMYAIIGAIKISAIAGSDTRETTLSNTIFKIKAKSTTGNSTLDTKTASVDYCRFLVDPIDSSNGWTQSSGNLTASGQTYSSKVEFTLYGALIPLD